MLLGAPSFLRAEGSRYRAQLTEISFRGALGERSVPLLDVVPPEGRRDGQLKRLQAMVAASPDRRIHVRNPGRTRSSNRSTILFASDESWYLEVMGDGSRLRYRGNIDDRKELEQDRAVGRLEMEALERLGRNYVTQQLASLVSIPEAEKLVFLGTKYLREGSASADDGTFTSEVVSNIAIFGREVQGTFVAGPGSKIAVWFSNRGEPVGFYIDWPTYRVSQATQATLGINDVLDRISRYADNPLGLIQTNSNRFECGYVDLGVFKRKGAPIQTGCLAHHDGPLTSPLMDDLIYASIEVIPIGVRVVPDPAWPVTSFIAAGRPWDICQTSKKICAEPRAPWDRRRGR